MSYHFEISFWGSFKYQLWFSIFHSINTSVSAHWKYTMIFISLCTGNLTEKYMPFHGYKMDDSRAVIGHFETNTDHFRTSVGHFQKNLLVVNDGAINGCGSNVDSSPSASSPMSSGSQADTDTLQSGLSFDNFNQNNILSSSERNRIWPVESAIIIMHFLSLENNSDFDFSLSVIALLNGHGARE